MRNITSLISLQVMLNTENLAPIASLLDSQDLRDRTGLTVLESV